MTRTWVTQRAYGVLIAMFLLLGAPHAASPQEKRSVLEEILDIMREHGQITEAQRKALLERAEREAKQAKAERDELKKPEPVAQGAGAQAAQAQEVRSSPVTGGIDNGRPFLSSADGDFKIELGGLLQFDYHAVEEGARTLSGSDLGDQFLMRRTRLELAGQVFRWIDYQIEAEFSESVSLKTAYLNFGFLPELGLRVGQFKVPFSLEELTSSRFIDFVERSVLTEIAPGRDIGLTLRGDLFDGSLEYAVGLFNGSGENTADTNDGKELAGRVTLAPFKRGDSYWLKGLQLGANVTWGDQDDSSSARGRTGARTDRRFTYFAAHPTRGEATRFGGDVVWRVGPAALKFEYGEQRNERRKSGVGGFDAEDIVARGWYVSGTYLLTGEDKPLNGPVVPKRPFAPIVGQLGPGAWEVGLRYGELKFESDSPLDFFDGDISNGLTGGRTTAENGVRAVTAGVNWYLNSRMRAMLNWNQYWYDNALGTPFSCRVVSCGASTLRPSNDGSWEILSRVQLWF